MKLGKAFGKRLIHGSSALQGCTLSILMVNGIFSVLMAHLNKTCPQVQATTFIDDMKVWAKRENIGMLQSALAETVEFDRLTGQLVSEEKTTVVSRREKQRRRFLIQVGRTYKSKSNAKSLGNVHRADKKRAAVTQDQRANKAVATLQKIAQLPLCNTQKALHIKTNAHPQWLHGTEFQIPSKRALARLRTHVVKIFANRLKRIRSPWLFLATYEDVFIDPFAALAKQLLVKIRALAWTHPELATKVLKEAALVQRTVEQTNNGLAAVLAFVCNSLGWTLNSEEPFYITTTPQGNGFCIKGGSKSFLVEELDHACRIFLLNQVPERHDFFDDLDSIDVFLTRFLHDSSFATKDDMELLEPFLRDFPKDIQRVRAILQKLWSGQIFTSVRCKAAGLSASDKCFACGEREDHLHLFKQCPFYAQTRPPDVFQRSTWCTGIFPRSQIYREWAQEQKDLPVLPPEMFCACTSDPVFIDGSAFANKWQPLRTAASAFWSASHEWNAVLPGCDQSSQRAEIYALLYCLAFFRGDLTVYTNCMNVLNGFNRLVGCHFSPSVLGQLDNADLWEKMGQVLARRQGTISLRKVKAHVSNHAQQCQYLTEGNSRADALAKSCAKEKLRVKISCFRDLISQAVGLQVHLVTTLMSRTEHFAHDDLERFNSPRIRTATSCSCVPLRRVRSKISACTGACRVFSEVIKPGSVETSFLDILSSGNPIPENLRQTLAIHYIKFHRLRSLPRVLGPVGRLHDFSSVTSGRNRISQLAARTLAGYLSAPHWFVPVRGATAEERVSWIELSLDFVATHGWQPGWIHSELTLGKLARRFQVFVVRLLKANRIPIRAISSLHLSEFGFNRVASIYLHKKFVFPDKVLAFLLQCSRSNPGEWLDPTQKKHVALYWKPSFDVLL